MGKIVENFPIQASCRTILLIEPDSFESEVFIWCMKLEKADEKSVLVNDTVRIEFPYPVKDLFN